VTLRCERCDETENVTRFTHFPSWDQEWLCWEHRWPIIRERLHGPGATGPPGSVVVEQKSEQREAAEGQTTPQGGGQSLLGEFL